MTHATTRAAAPRGVAPATTVGHLVRDVVLGASFCVAALVVVALLVAFTDYTFGYFSRDPASTLGANPFVGLLSYVGVLVAWATAVICLLTATFLARARGWSFASPFVAAGLGIAYLALDDLLQFHEEVLPKLGLAQDVVLATYAVVAVGYVAWHRHALRTADWPLLALALATLAASLGLDQFGDAILPETGKAYFEEGTKLFGFVLLGIYFLRFGARLHAQVYTAAAPR